MVSFCAFYGTLVVLFMTMVVVMPFIITIRWWLYDVVVVLFMIMWRCFGEGSVYGDGSIYDDGGGTVYGGGTI